MPYYTAEQLEKAKKWYAKPKPPKPPTPPIVSAPPTPTITEEAAPTTADMYGYAGAPAEPTITLQEQMRQDRERRLQELIAAGYSPHEAFRIAQYNPATTSLTGQRTGTATAMGQPTSMELYYQGVLGTPAYISDLQTRFEHRGGYGEYHPGGADPRFRKETQFGVWPGLPELAAPTTLGWQGGAAPVTGGTAPKRYRTGGGGTSRGATSPSYFALGLVNWRIGL